MRGAWLAVLLLLGLWQASSTAAPTHQDTPECGDWRDCRSRTEEALASGAFEDAHDLAWRAVQLGPKGDPDLMFLLARAQCRSGRPDDALVMVRRLAERGVPTEAETHPDLARTRGLPGWAEVASLVERVKAAAAPPVSAPEPAVTAVRPTASGEAPREAAGGSILAEEAIPFSRDRFAAAGLAYDEVSHRFLIGDRDGRKVRVIGEGLDQAVDLVRSESAGFGDVQALDIDHRRGDLWVASAEPGSDAAALHRLQLVSGRPIKAYPLALTPGRVPVDLAVSGAGSVLVLVSDGRVWRLKPGADKVEAPVDLDVSGVTTIASGPSESQALVAHRDGIIRVDVATGRTTALTAPEGVALAGFVRLRAYRDGLVGLRAEPDGSLRLVRLRLASNALRVRNITVFDTRIERPLGAIALAVAGDHVAVLGDAPSFGSAPDSASPPPSVLAVRRLRLQ